MTDPLTPDDLAALRQEHSADAFEPEPCIGCFEEYPCLVVRLLDEVERLRRPQSERDQMARLQTEWEQRVIARAIHLGYVGPPMTFENAQK